MAADLGTVRLGAVSGTLVLRLDDGSEVEVGRVSFPIDAHVSMTMPARSAAQAEQDQDADRREADEPEPPAPVPLDRERIDALPVGSVILDRDSDRVERRADGWHRITLFGKPVDQHLQWSGAPGLTYGPYTLASLGRALAVGTKVRVIDNGDTIRGLAGRHGVVIDPAQRSDLGDSQVLVYIPEYESGRDDRAWAFRPERLTVVVEPEDATPRVGDTVRVREGATGLERHGRIGSHEHCEGVVGALRAGGYAGEFTVGNVHDGPLSDFVLVERAPVD